MGEKTLYQDGVEVQGDDLNNTEEYLINDIKRKLIEFTQEGVATGLRVTGSGGGSVTISAGVGYNVNGERIYLPADETVPCPAGGYYFICLIYTEVEETSKPHEATGDAYFTRIRETYTITVLSEFDYDILPQENKDDILVVAVVNGSIIQQSVLTDDVVTSTELLLQGIDLQRFGITTQDGRAYFNYEWSEASRVGYLWYKSPNDTTFGSVLTINADGEYSIYSNNGDLLRIRAKLGLIPRENEETFIDVSRFYEDNMTGSSKDGLHRVSLGTSLPRETNPHGIATENIDGESVDLEIHRQRMHINCIKGRANTLKPQMSGNRIKVAYLHTNDRYFIKGKEFSSLTGSNYITITGSGGSKYVALDEEGKLVQSVDEFDNEYLPICKVDISGGNLSNLIDMRDFYSHGEHTIQKDSINHNKFFVDNPRFRLTGESIPSPRTALTQRNLWDEGDNTLLQSMVRGDGSNADALHEHGAPSWTDKWYLKSILGKGMTPNPPEGIPVPSPPYDGSEFRPMGTTPNYESASSVIGSVISAITSTVPPPSSYVAPAQDSIEKSLSGTARVGEDLTTLQETIDYLASLMRDLKNRNFPTESEVMHTSGRMLNLTFVPLPNNNLNTKDDAGNYLDGKWTDGEEVIEEECTWFVSPTAIWGIGGVHLPWVYICSTFGLGTGGDNDPTGDWDWNRWCNWFDTLINGNFLYGRWVIAFFAQSAGDIITMLSQVLIAHMNYQIVGSHQTRLDGEYTKENPVNERGGEPLPHTFDNYNSAWQGKSFDGNPRNLDFAGAEEWDGETFPVPPGTSQDDFETWIYGQPGGEPGWMDKHQEVYNQEDKPANWRGTWKNEYDYDAYSMEQQSAPEGWPLDEEGKPIDWPPDSSQRGGKPPTYGEPTSGLPTEGKIQRDGGGDEDPDTSTP
jgi:hypothetical protein